MIISILSEFSSKAVFILSGVKANLLYKRLSFINFLSKIKICNFSLSVILLLYKPISIKF